MVVEEGNGGGEEAGGMKDPPGKASLIYVWTLEHAGSTHTPINSQHLRPEPSADRCPNSICQTRVYN